MSGPTRRDAVAAMVAAAGTVAAAFVGGGAAEAGTVLPPTAGALPDFLARCIRCFRCGEVCTAGCIAFHPPWVGRLAGSPYIEPRVAGCNTCMRCTNVCPTGALTPTHEDERLEAVDMGFALVDEQLCLSHQGRVCGVCHDACPFPGDAIALEPQAKPRVLEACVGCGRCEERWPQGAAAIRVFRSDPGERWSGPRRELG